MALNDLPPSPEPHQPISLSKDPSRLRSFVTFFLVFWIGFATGGMSVYWLTSPGSSPDVSESLTRFGDGTEFIEDTGEPTPRPKDIPEEEAVGGQGENVAIGVPPITSAISLIELEEEMDDLIEYARLSERNGFEVFENVEKCALGMDGLMSPKVQRLCYEVAEEVAKIYPKQLEVRFRKIRKPPQPAD